MIDAMRSPEPGRGMAALGRGPGASPMPVASVRWPAHEAHRAGRAAKRAARPGKRPGRASSRSRTREIVASIV
jgi:hypothetical protein